MTQALATIRTRAPLRARTVAATVPAGLVSTQVGTLVKLIRVMMLGPVVACIAVSARGLRGDRSPSAKGTNSFFKTVPWFIAGFFALAAFRSLSLIPAAAVFPLQKAAGILTVMSMAALGLGVDLRVIGRVGGKVTAAVTLSLLFLLIVSLGLVRFIAPAS